MLLIHEQGSLLVKYQSVARYFDHFNRGDFRGISQLFVDDGRLLPPFEVTIVGRSAICAYLQREAEGMKAKPRKVWEEAGVGDRQRVVVQGSVIALVFTVNAAWFFDIDASGKLEQVEVKLLASLQDLLNLRPKA